VLEAHKQLVNHANAMAATQRGHQRRRHQRQNEIVVGCECFTCRAVPQNVIGEKYRQSIAADVMKVPIAIREQRAEPIGIGIGGHHHVRRPRLCPFPQGLKDLGTFGIREMFRNVGEASRRPRGADAKISTYSQPAASRARATDDSPTPCRGEYRMRTSRGSTGPVVRAIAARYALVGVVIENANSPGGE
jgi:hypothetical protein